MHFIFSEQPKMPSQCPLLQLVHSVRMLSRVKIVNKDLVWAQMTKLFETLNTIWPWENPWPQQFCVTCGKHGSCLYCPAARVD